MKHLKSMIFLLLILALMWPATVYAKEGFDDKVVFGGSFTLLEGESLDGSLVIFGGAATLEPGSIANGDVVLIGGTVEIAGDVNGNVVGIGGAVRLREEAVVNGDLMTLGATLDREDGARVNGQVISGTDVPFTFNVPNADGVNVVKTPQVNLKTSNPILDVMWFFFRTFMYAALAVLLVIFFSKQTDRVARAAFSQPVITGGAGLLTAILAPLALIAITITIILIPVTFVAVVLLVAAWLMGWVALGLEVGRRIAKALNIDLAPAIAAGIGTFILVFVLGGFSQAIACIGWLPQTLVGIWGLGAVLMTRFGTQDYEISGSVPSSTVVDVDAKLPEVVGNVESPDLKIENDSSSEENLPPDS
jgi:hypothetical protein